MNTNPSILAIPALATLLLAALLTGCASNLSGSTYSRDDARRSMSVDYGRVEAVRLVVIEGTDTKIGAGTGAILGGMAGNKVGEGRGATVGAVIGAVAGGVAGTAAEEALTRSQGIEVTVRLDNGRIMAVVQEQESGVTFTPGDRVRVITGNGRTRVSQ